MSNKPEIACVAESEIKRRDAASEQEIRTQIPTASDGGDTGLFPLIFKVCFEQGYPLLGTILCIS